MDFEKYKEFRKRGYTPQQIKRVLDPSYVPLSEYKRRQSLPQAGVDFTPVSEFPKMPLSERLKSIARPVGGFLREAGGSVYAPLAEATTGLPRKIMGKEPLQKVNFLGQDFRTPSGAGKEAGQAFAEGKIKKGLGIAGGSAFDVITLGWGGAVGTIGKQTTKALIKRGVGKGTATALGVGASLAPLGAGYGATGAMEQEQGVGGIIKSAGTGALLATGLGFGGVKLSEAITKRIAKKAETIVDDLEIEIKEKATPEQKKAIENALQDGVGEQEIKELVVKSKERQIVENIAQEQDPIKISSLLKDKIAKEDIPTLSKALKNINDPEQVARLLDKYDPDTINAKLVDDLALADTEKQITSLLKGKASKETIEGISPILTTLDDQETIIKTMEEFQISLKKVASDIDEISTKAEPTVKAVETEVKEPTKANKKIDTTNAEDLSDKAVNSFKNVPQDAELKPNRLRGENISIEEARTSLAKNGENIKERIVFGKDDNGNIVLKDGRHLLEAYRREGISVPKEKVKFEDGSDKDFVAKKTQKSKTQKEAPKNEYSKLKDKVASKIRKIEGTGKEKERGVARSLREKAVANGLEDFDLPTYKQLETKKVQPKLAREFVDSVDEETAIGVALGRIEPPKGLLPEAVFLDLEQKAILTGDSTLARKLALESALVDEATEMGRRIQIWSLRNENSPVKAMGDILQARMAKKDKKITRRKEKLVSDLDFKIQDAEFILKDLVC